MIAIMDYGVGNLFSLKSSLAQLGQDTVVTADTDTIRRIALMCKMAGTDIHHIGDTGYTGMALAENIMAYSIAVRGIRHTYHRMAISVER